MIILDGALGTELTRRGENTNLPLWSARALMDAPQVVAQIHADYLAAGAEVLTANTFRTNFRTFEHAGLPNPHTLARDLTFKAVALAKTQAMQKWQAAWPRWRIATRQSLSQTMKRWRVSTPSTPST